MPTADGPGIAFALDTRRMTRPTPEVLASLDAPRVLVVGDLVMDRYLSGTVDRISPEAPIQVLRVEEETERLGCSIWKRRYWGVALSILAISCAIR